MYREIIAILDIGNSPHDNLHLLGKEDQHHQSVSVLLPMASISKDEYDVIPGKFKYEVLQKNETRGLVITTASITGDYHNPDALWFQFLGMGERMFRDAHDGV